jgi:hypothetical protein
LNPVAACFGAYFAPFNRYYSTIAADVVVVVVVVGE